MEKILSIDVGGTYVKGCLVDKSGNISFQEKIKVAVTYERFLDEIYLFVQDIKSRNDFNRDGSTLAGVVVALPGGYDIKNDIIFAPNLSLLNEKHIKNDLSKLLDLPVIIENDANLAAYGEYIFGEKKKIDNMVFCTLGTGFGGGLILNRHLLQSNITIFEVGHMSIDYNGTMCSCGRKGCVDKYCSVTGLQTIYEKLTGVKYIKPEELGQLALHKDNNALKTFETFGKYLAQAFANLAALFCPEKIKFGGGLSELAPYFLEQCREEFEKIVFPAYKGRVIIEQATLKNKAGMLGGAALFFDL